MLCWVVLYHGVWRCVGSDRVGSGWAGLDRVVLCCCLVVVLYCCTVVVLLCHVVVVLC